MINHKKKKKKKKERTCKIVDFAVSADHRIQQCVKRRISTSTLQGNWKKLWNTKVTIVPIVIGGFGRVIKGLLKGLEDLEVGTITKDLVQGMEDLEMTGQIETVQTTA